MIINIRELYVDVENRKYDITKKERQFILLLADNKIHSIDEVKKYMKFKTRNPLYQLNFRLNDKIPGLQIKNRYKKGYYTDAEILVTY